jgi:hypothetical protein
MRYSSISVQRIRLRRRKLTGCATDAIRMVCHWLAHSIATALSIPAATPFSHFTGAPAAYNNDKCPFRLIMTLSLVSALVTGKDKFC